MVMPPKRAATRASVAKLVQITGADVTGSGNRRTEAGLFDRVLIDLSSLAPLCRIWLIPYHQSLTVRGVGILLTEEKHVVKSGKEP